MSTRAAIRRREVLDAARRVIMDEGLDATTLRKISAAGGFTTGVVNHYFPDKTAVINAAFEDMSTEWVDALETLLAEADSSAERLAKLVEYSLPSKTKQQEVWRMWVELYGMAGRDEDIARQLIETDRQWEAVVRGVVVECQETGLLRTSDVDTAAYAVTRLMDGLALRAWISGKWAEQRLKLIDSLVLLGFRADALSSVRR